MSEDLTAASKFLACVLRHDPSAVGLELSQGGWVPVEELLAAVAHHGHSLSPAVLGSVRLLS